MRAPGSAVFAPDQRSVRDGRPELARSLNLAWTVLFGLGVTIGAGVYVLIGATAGRAGDQAPLAFGLAALVMAPTAATFAEFATRIPKSAGEAAYVGLGFNSKALSLLVGCLVLSVGVVSAAAISRGSAGYIRQLIPAPTEAIIIVVLIAMGAVAAWGIAQSVALAGMMTLIEIGGLGMVVAAGFIASPNLIAQSAAAWTGLTDAAVLSGLISATLLAFFAFIGFESLANIAEEVKQPERTLPKAIFITLGLSTLLYVLVAWVALASVPRAELAAAHAPLSLVFERTTGVSPVIVSLIAVIATLNGVIVQMVMASRVLYGMADQGLLPGALAYVAPRTRTPIVATALVVAVVITLALSVPIEPLAEATSRVTLVIFAIVNAALVVLKRREAGHRRDGIDLPIWVPAVGCILSIALLAGTIAA